MLTVYLDNGANGKSRVIEFYPPASGGQLMEKVVHATVSISICLLFPLESQIICLP